ncbi:hypothetical protein EZV62_024507 [Acer yangbiense]|uniref:ABC transporter domain-containing protein n=1 Tax=Acer yangbiense TaxID=1000413 RepID=A0A5C7GWC4_9ROSI|nr:hypothetical protein EZV62_024507 [Acer yangbiense]
MKLRKLGQEPAKFCPELLMPYSKENGFWDFFQGTAGTDIEDCAELSVSFDDQGETYPNNSGSHTCSPKVSIADKGLIEKRLIVRTFMAMQYNTRFFVEYFALDLIMNSDEIKFRLNELLECMGRLNQEVINLKAKPLEAKSNMAPTMVESLQQQRKALERDKFRSKELLECMGRLDQEVINLKEKLLEAKSNRAPTMVESLQQQRKALERQLFPMYTQIARFAELHETSSRMATEVVIREGKVLLDGENIINPKLEWLRSQIGLVTQEPALLSFSIMDNIAYGRDSTLEQIEESAKIEHL